MVELVMEHLLSVMPPPRVLPQELCPQLLWLVLVVVLYCQEEVVALYCQEEEGEEEPRVPLQVESPPPAQHPWTPSAFPIHSRS